MPRLRYSQQDMYSRWKACGSTAAREKHAALLPYTQSASFRIAWTTRGKGPRRCTVTFQEWNPHVWPSNQKNSSLDSDSVTVRVLPMPVSHIGAAQRSSFPSSLRDNAPRPPCPGAPKERTRRGSTAAEVPRPEDAAQAPPGPWFAWPPPSAPAPPHARWQEPLSARPPLLPSPQAAIRPRFPPPLPSPAPMWRPGRGRQGRPRQPPPLRACPSPPRRVRTARFPPQGRPALTAAGPGASTAPSGHRDRQSVFM